MVDYKYKELYSKTSIPKQLIISVDGREDDITNDDLAYENFELIESICSESNLKFGSCESSQLKFRVLNNSDSLKNRNIVVREYIDGHNDELFQFGKYTVESDKMTSDRKYRDVVAYDAIHSILGTNYIEWYAALEFPLSCKNLRDSFFSYIGIEQVEISLPFDDVMIPIDGNISSDCTGATILQSIGELNACFGHMNREGKFAWIILSELEPPVVDIEKYSSNSLVQYESFFTARISKLQISAGDTSLVFGESATDKENLYIIDSNILLNGMDESQIDMIGDKLLSLYAKYIYRPFSGEFRGNPCYEVGDSVRYYDGGLTIDSYILQRTLTGIRALTDTYTAEGNEFYDNKLNSTKRLVQTEVNKVLSKSGLEIKPFTNKYSLSIQGKAANAAQIAFKTTDDTVIAFAASIPFTMDLDGIVEAAYYLDETQINDIPFRQYFEKGQNVLTLFYEFEALKDTAGVFALRLSTDYVESTDRTHDAQIKGLIQFAQNGGTYSPADIDATVPTADIVKGAIKAVVFSSDLVKNKHRIWDGTIDIEETIEELTVKNNDVVLKEMSEYVSCVAENPPGANISETLGLLSFSSPVYLYGITDTVEAGCVIKASSINAENKEVVNWNPQFVNMDGSWSLITTYSFESKEQAIDSGRMSVLDMDFTQFASVSEVTLSGYTPELNTLYLYKDGNECTDVTGGWVAEAMPLNQYWVNSKMRKTPTLTKGESSMHVIQDCHVPSANLNENSGCGVIHVNNDVDVTEYKTLNILLDTLYFKNTCTSTNYESLFVLFVKSRTSPYYYADAVTKKNVLANRDDAYNHYVVSVDVSGISGNYDIGIGTDIYSSSDFVPSIEYSVSKAWLEK